MDYKKYLEEIENKVLIPYSGMITNDKPQIVPLKPGKLDSKPIADFVGSYFEYNGVLAINYYGFYKVSSGILDRIKKINRIFRVESVMSPIVHFNSVHANHIQLADKSLLGEWSEFKKYIAEIRWNN